MNIQTVNAFVADEALRDRMIAVGLEFFDSAIVDRGHEPTGRLTDPAECFYSPRVALGGSFTGSVSSSTEKLTFPDGLAIDKIKTQKNVRLSQLNAIVCSIFFISSLFESQ